MHSPGHSGCKRSGGFAPMQSGPDLALLPCPDQAGVAAQPPTHLLCWWNLHTAYTATGRWKHQPHNAFAGRITVCTQLHVWPQQVWTTAYDSPHLGGLSLYTLHRIRMVMPWLWPGVQSLAKHLGKCMHRANNRDSYNGMHKHNTVSMKHHWLMMQASKFPHACPICAGAAVLL